METRHRRSASTGDANIDLRQIVSMLKSLQESTANSQQQLDAWLQTTGLSLREQIQATNEQIQTTSTSLREQIQTTKEQIQTTTTYLQEQIQTTNEQILTTTTNLQEQIQAANEQIRAINGNVEARLQTTRNDIQHTMETQMAQLKEVSKTTACEGKSIRNPLLKSNNWPKYRGADDKIHPMTFLQSTLRLCEDITDQKIALNYIRLSLEYRALDWFELISDQCQTVQQFAEAFKQQYWSPLHQDRQKVKLITGKYSKNGTLNREHYACDLYNRSKHIPNLTEQEIARYLLSHFILSDNQAIVCQDVQSMEQLMTILRKLDNLTSLEKSSTQTFQNTQRSYKPYNSNHHFNRQANNRQENATHSDNTRQQFHSNYRSQPSYQSNHNSNPRHYNWHNGQQYNRRNYYNNNQTNRYPYNRGYRGNQNSFHHFDHNDPSNRSSQPNSYRQQNNEFYQRKQQWNDQQAPQANINTSFRSRPTEQNQSWDRQNASSRSRSPSIEDRGKKKTSFVPNGSQPSSSTAPY